MSKGKGGMRISLMKNRNLWILSISQLLTTFSNSTLGVYFIFYISELGGSALTFGIIAFTSSFTWTLLLMPGGSISKQGIRKKVIVLSSIFSILRYVLYLLASSWQFFLVGGLVGSLEAIGVPARRSLLIDSLPVEERGRGFSILNMCSIASGLAGPFVAHLLYYFYGLIGELRIVATVGILLSIFNFLIQWKYLEEHAGERKLPLTLQGILRDAKNSFIEGANIWVKSPISVKYLFFSDLLLTSAWIIFTNFLGLYSHEKIKMALMWIPFLFLLIRVGDLVASYPIGWLVDRADRKALYLTAAGLHLIVFLLLMVCKSIPLLVLLLVALSLGGCMADLVTDALEGDLIPKENFSIIIGFNYAMYSMAFGLLVLLSSYIYGLSSFLWLTISLLLSLLSIFLISRIPWGETNGIRIK